MKNIIVFFLLIGLVACKDKPIKTNQKSIKKLNLKSTSLAMYIGTYTKKEDHVNGKAEGIYLVEMDTLTGHLQLKETVAEVINPSFVVVSPDEKNVYAVSELSDKDDTTGYIYVYSINQDKSLLFLQKLPTRAFAPCQISFDRDRKFVFVSNYVGGIVTVFKRSMNGSLTLSDTVQLKGSTEHPRQESSHPHSVTVSPENDHAFIADLGSNKIWRFLINHNRGTLSPDEIPFIELQKGAGPRHFTFHSNGKFAYVINELDNTINAFTYDELTGVLSNLQNISTLPSDYKGESYCADIHIHPNGKFLYGSNRGHDSIVVYKIDIETGKLELIGYFPTKGKFPRNFSIDPSGKFLYVANQNSNTIVQFYIDQKTGALTFANHKLEVKTPVSISWCK